jgi:hypothetical protein
MPSITPDRDQVEAFKSTRTHTPSSSSTVSKVPVKTTADTQPIKQTSSSTLSKLSTFLIYLLIAGAGYWVYLQDIKTTAIINSAEQRIAGLERQLSATGEEMGESAVEMKVRIETLGKTSDKLWLEMDKLWASAWRKNQSQIKKLQKETKSLTNLSTTQRQSVTTTLATIKDLSDKQVATEFSIDALKEQLKSSQLITEKIDTLSLALSSIDSDSQRRDSQQISLASRVTKLSEQNKQLLIQVKALEKKLAQSDKSIPDKTAPPPAVGN